MLRRVASANSNAVGGSPGKARSNAKTPVRCAWKRVDPMHQQVEQPVARCPFGWGIGQCQLISRPAEAQQDRGAPGKSLACPRQRQVGGPRRRRHADGSPALLRRQPEGGRNQRRVELDVLHAVIMGCDRRFVSPARPDVTM